MISGARLATVLAELISHRFNKRRCLKSKRIIDSLYIHTCSYNLVHTQTFAYAQTTLHTHTHMHTTQEKLEGWRDGSAVTDALVLLYSVVLVALARNWIQFPAPLCSSQPSVFQGISHPLLASTGSRHIHGVYTDKQALTRTCKIKVNH